MVLAKGSISSVSLPAFVIVRHDENRCEDDGRSTVERENICGIQYLSVRR